MVRLLRAIDLRSIIKCVCKSAPAIDMMPKRFFQSPPEKKLKPNQVPTSAPKTVNNADVHNLNNRRADDTMQCQNFDQCTPLQDAILEKEICGIKVEYLDVPTKSENDKKDYRVIRLDNGLTALLISDVHGAVTTSDDSDDDDDNEKTDKKNSDGEGGSDCECDQDEDADDDEESESDEEDGPDEPDDIESPPKRAMKEEKMAACGLCVGVGSFSDPPEIPGMAHFLEHMVFMGSEKYPEENDFDAFIKKKGGSDNASTECEYTTFYFEVQEKHLLSALDRFAQFFIKPLMKRDAITRERESVESEFQMALPSDLYRKEQLFSTFAQPSHPATKFSWGNLVTLRDNVSDDKLYEELHQFRERHYSAHRMTVAIQARLPLSTLEEYIVECFSHVPNNGLPANDFTMFKGVESFNTPGYRRMYVIKPTKDVCQVELTWVMPPLHDLYKSKPHQYLSWIIGHEGKGSLISYLRRKMWCLEISSGNAESGFEHSSMYALFSLYLVLTDKGHENLKKVLDAVFSYINMVRQKGPQKAIYDEIFQIEETNFRFADEEDPVEYVEDLCENMQFYPPKDYITGSDLFFEYNPEAIEMCMSYLTPENVNIIIFNKKFNEDEFDKVEPWFKTKYTDMEIPNDWIENWKSIEPLSDFHLPLPNVFLTTDFSLIPLPENVPKYPTKIHSDDTCEIWYRPDPKFRLPECYIYFYLISPLVVEGPKSGAMTDLVVEILKQLLVQELYPAVAAGLNQQIQTAERGIVVKVNGFNQNLPLLLNTITKYIANCKNLVTRDLYNVMKEEQLKIYYNTFLKPAKLVRDVRLSLLMEPHWSAVDKHKAMADVTFEEFLEFVNSFLDRLFIQSLVQGNMTQESVVTNIQECVSILPCKPLSLEEMPKLKVVQVPRGTQYCKVKSFNKNDVNSVVTNYYQSGMASIELSVIIELLIMIMEEPLFNQLRTQEQLGYNVFCLRRSTLNILGYSITVCTQADKYTTEHVDDRIEAFLDTFKETLEATSEKELDSVKEALTKLKQCADIHLKEEASRNWDEIMNEYYMFDRTDKEVVAIQEIKVDELREWMASHTMNGDKVRKLSVQVVGAITIPDSPASPDPEEMERILPVIASTDSPASPPSEKAIYSISISSVTKLPSTGKTVKVKDILPIIASTDSPASPPSEEAQGSISISSITELPSTNDTIEVEGERAKRPIKRYELEFVAVPDKEAKRAPGMYITDVQSFKKDLYIYPTIKHTSDS